MTDEEMASLLDFMQKSGSLSITTGEGVAFPSEEGARGYADMHDKDVVRIGVLERMEVWNLWMHRPWNHGNLARLFRNSRVTSANVQAALRRDLEAAKAVEEEALRQLIPITEPFTGLSFNDQVFVLGPTPNLYEQQIAHFECTPLPVAPLLPPLRRRLLVPRVEDWATETLDGDCDTSAENNTSVIPGGEVRGRLPRHVHGRCR